MAYVLYGLSPADVITDPSGNTRAGVTGQVYTQPVGGTVFTQTFAAVPPNMTVGSGTSGSVTTDSLGRFGFYTEDYYGTLWFDLEGTRWRVSPAPDQVITAQTGAITADLQDQLDTMMAAAQADIDAATATADEALNVASGLELAINVKTAGAVGDGLSDDTNVFLDVGVSGRVGYVPAGTYKITAADTDLPQGYWFGEGTLVFTGTNMDGETQKLDKWVPQPINSVMIGDGHRNIVAVGQNAALNAGNESGANVAVGTNALMNPSKSQRNTAIGSGAAKMLGDYDRAGVTTTNGNARRNVWVGTDAGWASVWADRNTYVGSNAGKWAGDPDPIAHQHDFFDGVPVPSLAGIDAAGRWPTARTDLVGPSSAPAQVAVNELDNADNVGVGRNTLLHAVKSSQCVAAGTNALAHGFLVRSSTAIGDGALRDGLSASYNTAVGASAMLQMASGQFNTALGNNALRLATHTDGHVAIGYGALENFTGGITSPSSSTARRNIAIGYGAANTSIAATNSIAIGPYAVFGDYNNAIAVGGAANAVTFGVAVGSSANAAGASGVAIGANAAATHTSSVALGANAATTANNQIQLGASTLASLRSQVALTVVSDARDKVDVRDTKLGLDFVEQLRPVDFRYRPRDLEETDPRLRHGFIAQEIQAVAAEFGGVDDDDPERLGLTESQLIAPLIKAVQELSERLRQAEAKIAELTA